MTPESPDLPLIKHQIEVQLDEYARAIGEYAAFVASWRARNAPLEPAEEAAE